MAKAKAYKSVAYLKLQFFDKGKSVEQIAAENGVSINTIRTALRDAGLVK